MSFATQSTPSSCTSAPLGSATGPGARLWIRICDASTLSSPRRDRRASPYPPAWIARAVLESFSPTPIVTSPALSIERPPAVSTIVATGLVLGFAVFSAT